MARSVGRELLNALVRTTVRYLNPEWKTREEIPEIGSRETRRANTSVHDVTIHDARPRIRAGELDLDTQGFALFSADATPFDYRDDAEIERHYYPRAFELATQATGATRVFPWQHVVRTETPTSFNDAYARFVHCDYQRGKAAKLARYFLGKQGIELDPEASWNFSWVNVWQPVEVPALRNPLALIDAETLGDDDLVEYQYSGYAENVVSTMATYNPAHRFYYVREMRTDEALVFKQLDSRAGRAPSCPHTSFDDPSAPADAPGRRSIEVRLLCAHAS